MGALCADCLTEIGTPFVVLKKVRDLPADTPAVEAKLLEMSCYDQFEICADCAGWYGDDAIDLSEENR